MRFPRSIFFGVRSEKRLDNVSGRHGLSNGEIWNKRA